jgi:hypothetical protein
MEDINKNGTGPVFESIPKRPNIYESAEIALAANRYNLNSWVSQGKTKVEATREVFRDVLNSEIVGEDEKEIIKAAIKLYLSE